MLAPQDHHPTHDQGSHCQSWHHQKANRKQQSKQMCSNPAANRCEQQQQHLQQCALYYPATSNRASTKIGNHLLPPPCSAKVPRCQIACHHAGSPPKPLAQAHTADTTHCAQIQRLRSTPTSPWSVSPHKPFPCSKSTLSTKDSITDTHKHLRVNPKHLAKHSKATSSFKSHTLRLAIPQPTPWALRNTQLTNTITHMGDTKTAMEGHPNDISHACCFPTATPPSAAPTITQRARAHPHPRHPHRPLHPGRGPYPSCCGAACAVRPRPHGHPLPPHIPLLHGTPRHPRQEGGPCRGPGRARVHAACRGPCHARPHALHHPPRGTPRPPRCLSARSRWRHHGRRAHDPCTAQHTSSTARHVIHQGPL